MAVEEEDPLSVADPATVGKRRRGCLIVITVALALFLAFWVLVRPGVFTIQPIGALPDGITVIYHSRNPQMPFFSSPDGLCLDIQGSVSLICRMASIGAAEEIIDRVIIRLPYIEMAYLLSTGGATFDR